MRLTWTMFVTLDGVVQAPGLPDEDRSGSFDQGGWAVPHMDDDLLRVMTAWYAQADAFVLRRRTYEIFAGWWPRVTDPNDSIARQLNSQPKYGARQ